MSKSEQEYYQLQQSDDFEQERSRPQDQTNEEWLQDYEAATGLKGPSHDEFKDSGESSMKFTDTGGADFEPAPDGMHVARCIRIIDLGTTRDTMYDKDKHDVFFMWELPSEIKEYQDKDGKTVKEPFTASKYYTMSLAEKAHLRHDLESWRSRPFTSEELEGFDPKNILGAPCMINIIHKPKKTGSGISVQITTVNPMPKNMACPPQVHPSVYFSLDEDYSQTVFDSLTKGIKERIQQSHEYKEINNPGSTNTGAENSDKPEPKQDDEFDDIPF